MFSRSFSRQALLFHPEFDRLDRVGRIDRVVLALIGVDQGRQDIEPISLRRARARPLQPLDLCEGCFVIRFASDRLDFMRDQPL